MQGEETVARGRIIAEKLPGAPSDAAEKRRENDEISSERARYAGKGIEQSRTDEARRCPGLRTATDATDNAPGR